MGRRVRTANDGNRHKKLVRSGEILRFFTEINMFNDIDFAKMEKDISDGVARGTAEYLGL
jgi:hypothetical protein